MIHTDSRGIETVDIPRIAYLTVFHMFVLRDSKLEGVDNDR